MEHTWRNVVNTNSNFNKFPRMLQKQEGKNERKVKKQNRMGSPNRGLMGILEKARRLMLNKLATSLKIGCRVRSGLWTSAVWGAAPHRAQGRARKAAWQG